MRFPALKSTTHYLPGISWHVWNLIYLLKHLSRVSNSECTLKISINPSSCFMFFFYPHEQKDLSVLLPLTFPVSRGLIWCAAGNLGELSGVQLKIETCLLISAVVLVFGASLVFYWLWNSLWPWGNDSPRWKHYSLLQSDKLFYTSDEWESFVRNQHAFFINTGSFIAVSKWFIKNKGLQSTSGKKQHSCSQNFRQADKFPLHSPLIPLFSFQSSESLMSKIRWH